MAVPYQLGFHFCLIGGVVASLSIILKEIFFIEQHHGVLLPFRFHHLYEQGSEVGTKTVSSFKMLILIDASERFTIEILTTISKDGTQIIHIITNYLDDVLRKVGIYITVIQPVIMVEPLFGHTQYAANCLRGKGHTLQFPEYQ